MAVDPRLIELVKQLRAETGAGLMDCRKAVEEAGGDLEQARKLLKQRGLALAAKRTGREAREGLIEAYIHFSGRFGALVEVNCETDFVARTDEFKQLARDLALQVAGMSPRYVRREDVPETEIERLKTEWSQEITEPGTRVSDPEATLQQRLHRYFAEVCLLEQPFVKDQSRTVNDRIADAVVRLRENIVVRRFIRFELGE